MNFIPGLNEHIRKQADALSYSVSDQAPNTPQDLFGSTGGLVVWAGASDQTIYGDPSVNWAFRAVHDNLHLKHGFDFTVPEEIELGRVQASMFPGKLGDFIYADIVGQAEFFLKNGHFPVDQKAFICDYLEALWGEPCKELR